MADLAREIHDVLTWQGHALHKSSVASLQAKSGELLDRIMDAQATGSDLRTRRRLRDDGSRQARDLVQGRGEKLAALRSEVEQMEAQLASSQAASNRPAADSDKLTSGIEKVHSERLPLDGGNDTSLAVDDETAEDREEAHELLISWSSQTWFYAWLFGVCCVCCPMGCAGGACFIAVGKDIVPDDSRHRDQGYGNLELESDEDDMLLKLLRRECRLMLLYPLIPIALAPWTTCGEGMPSWGYALYVPFLLRAKYIEWKILQGLNETGRVLSLGFVLGVLDHADWFTDGAFPVQAFMCEPDATASFAKAFHQSWAWPAAPLVQSLHFWGLVASLLITSASAQQLLGMAGIWSVTGHPSDDFSEHAMAAAELCGFGAVSDKYSARIKGGVRMGKLTAVFIRILLENCFQLWMQSSFFGLTFELTSDEGKTKVLLSLGLGLFSAIYKSILGFREVDAYVAGPGYFIPPFFALLTVAWTLAKLYYSFACTETHLWNLTTGCVH